MIPLFFFKTDNGNEPVREWLLAMSDDDCRSVGQDLMRVQFRWPVGMPLCRNLGDGIWEVRSNLSDGKIGRVLFCAKGDALIALHGFIKKTRRTPKRELEVASARKPTLESND